MRSVYKWKQNLNFLNQSFPSVRAGINHESGLKPNEIQLLACECHAGFSATYRQRGRSSLKRIIVALRDWIAGNIAAEGVVG